MIKILDYQTVDKRQIFARVEKVNSVTNTVTEILDSVKSQGDKALKYFAEKFDGVILDELKVTEEEIDKAFTLSDPEFVEVLKTARDNIKEFHEKQMREGFQIQRKDGVVLGQKVLPMERIGLYVPGGTASYPSTVLMNAIPAKIAGVKELVMVTPAKKDGQVSPEILVSAKIAGVDTIYKIGGAQAVGALAYGTESIKKVDKIVGPGNAYVAEAKRQVFGKVAIDMIAGPSEILIVADANCSAVNLSADLLSQAEHDKMASAVLITTDIDLAKKVQAELEVQIEKLPRREIARASIDDNGKIIVVKDIKTAIELSNEIAPEHLELCVDNPFELLEEVKNAGSVFLGKNCPEALGDYIAGTNHTLPTNGTARFASPLSVDDFIKKTQYIYYTESALDNVKEKVELFANKEGLFAHANSVTVRKENK